MFIRIQMELSKSRTLGWQGGGKVATGIVAAARIRGKGGCLRCRGDDSYGKFVDEDFIHHGLDTSYLKKREGKTTNFDIVLSNRETMGRCILYYPGTAEQLQAEELPLEYLTNTKYLFISMLNPVVDLAVDIARKAGAKIFIDADSDSEELRQMIPKLMCSLHQNLFTTPCLMAEIAGKTAKKSWRWGRRS